MTPNPLPPTAGSWTFPRRVWLVAFVVVLVLLTWRLLALLVLAFGAIVFAAVLRAIANALERYARVPRRMSLALTVLLIAALLGGGVVLLGDPLGQQLQHLRERLPAAIDAVMRWLNNHQFGTAVLQYVESIEVDARTWAQRAAGLAGMTFGALGSVGLMIVMGVYLAASPSLYRDGLVRLMPPQARPRVAEALDASGDALSRWLLGQLLSMLFVGSATALGLWLLDVPLAASVGVINGLLAFIPFFGAIAGGLLAVLLGFMQGPETALHVMILAVAIQQVEGHVLMPLVQRWAVNLPPVLGLAAAVMFGVLFGVGGILLATPMMVVLMVLVQKLYIEGVLEENAASASKLPPDEAP